MRILYDGYIYDFQQYGGINRYFNEIIQRLPSEATPFVSSYLGKRPFWPEHPRLQLIRSRPFAKAPALAALGRAWMHMRLKALQVDLHHPSYYFQISRLGFKRKGRPLVITVHDMIHELFSEQIDPDKSVATAKRRCIEQADAILCNSHHTQKDLLAFFPAVAGRTFVTPLASSMTVDPEKARAYPGLDNPYFLHVGGREGYKNFSVLLKAWAVFAPDHPGLQLRVVGAPWTDQETQYLRNHIPPNSIIHQGKVDDSELAILLRRSIALIYPSTYEGFGIPPLEAMRCETAVISSSSSSLPEVGGDAPLYFDPASPDELVQQLDRLSRSPGLRDECVARGKARAQLFSWDKTAALTLDVYRQLLR